MYQKNSFWCKTTSKKTFGSFLSLPMCTTRLITRFFPSPSSPQAPCRSLFYPPSLSLSLSEHTQQQQHLLLVTLKVPIGASIKIGRDVCVASSMAMWPRKIARYTYQCMCVCVYERERERVPVC